MDLVRTYSGVSPPWPISMKRVLDSIKPQTTFLDCIQVNNLYNTEPYYPKWLFYYKFHAYGNKRVKICYLICSKRQTSCITLWRKQEALHVDCVCPTRRRWVGWRWGRCWRWCSGWLGRSEVALLSSAGMGKIDDILQNQKKKQISVYTTISNLYISSY